MSGRRSGLTLQRLCLVGLAVVMGLGFALHTARAELETRVLSTTRGILGVPDAWVRGKPRAITLNGAHIELASGRSEEPLGAVLDRAERECRRRSGGLHARAQARAATRLAGGVLRIERDREGLVACLDLGLSELAPEALAAKLSDFARDGDLQQLGGVRMLRAQALAHGTFFVTTESQGAAPLWRMFPSEGDAPGVDPFELARPNGSRRLLSAWQEQGAPAIHVYESEQTLDSLWSPYLRKLELSGWQRDPHAPSQPEGARAALFMRDGHQTVVVAEAARGMTLVSILPLAAGPGAVQLR